jgi:predicted O-methyltransferase YrrM
MVDLPDFEPASRIDIENWIASATRAGDPFVDIAEATERHREQHQCDAYASSDGPLLGVLAAASGANRIIEVGTGLGYSTAWLARGAPAATIETLESDAEHIEIARSRLAQAGVLERVSILLGTFPGAANGLRPGYDMALYDAAIPGTADIDALYGLLRRGGLLVTSNLFLGQYDPTMPGLELGAASRRELLESDRWQTAFAGTKALSVRR